MKFKSTYIFIILLVIGIVIYNQFTKNKIVEAHGGGGGGHGGGGGGHGGGGGGHGFAGGRGGRGFGGGRGIGYGAAALGGYGLYRGYGGYYGGDGGGDGYDDIYYSYPYEQILYDAYGNPVIANQLTPLFV